jgi:hypothetical protein
MEDLVGGMLGLMVMVVYLVIGVIAIAFYIMGAIGLSRIAKDMGAGDKAFWAWFPIGNLYLIGHILGEMDLFGKRIGNLHLILPIANLVGSGIPAINIIVMIVTFAATIELCGIYEPQNKVWMGIFSAIGFAIIGKRIVNGTYPPPEEN